MKVEITNVIEATNKVLVNQVVNNVVLNNKLKFSKPICFGK
jgi:hypothetical protein